MRAGILIAAIVFLVIGCNKSDFEFENEYEKSYNAWLAFKQTVDNSYTYKTTGSSWVGLKWETTLTVSNGIVIFREFKFVSTEGFGEEIPAEDLEWTETNEDVGSRKNTAATEAITLDEVYEKAKEDWLRKRGNSKTFFETENNGIISLCGYTENDCADDCFRGIRIVSVEALKDDVSLQAFRNTSIGDSRVPGG